MTKNDPAPVNTASNARLATAPRRPPRHSWAVWVLLVASCGSKSSLSVGTDASIAAGGITSQGGFNGQGLGGNLSGAGGQGGPAGGVTGTGGSSGSTGPLASGGATFAGGIPGAGGVISSGGIVGNGGIPGAGGLIGSGGIQGTGGIPGTGGLTGSGGIRGTGGLAGGGGLTGSGRIRGTGGVSSSGGMAAGGVVGTGGSSLDGGGASCANGKVCGGDLVGTWTVTSSCLVLSGDMDVSLTGLGCRTVPVTGSLQVTGTWIAKANGDYLDNTVTTGSMELSLDDACLSISSVRVECSRVSAVFMALGWTTSTCAIGAGGKCHCSTTANQRGGIGVVSPWASTWGSYRASGGGLSVDDSVDYGYCVSGNTLSMIPKPTILPVTGAIVLQRDSSAGAGGATGTGGTNAP